MLTLWDREYSPGRGYGIPMTSDRRLAAERSSGYKLSDQTEPVPTVLYIAEDRVKAAIRRHDASVRRGMGWLSPCSSKTSS